MAKDSNNESVFDELMRMAERYNVNNNALFVEAAKQYALQQRVIASIKAALDAEDSLMTTKEYVKGRENVYANPLIKELPKHSDSANKTAQTMLSIIQELGRETRNDSRLGALRNE